MIEKGSVWYKWPVYCKLFGCYIFMFITSITLSITNIEDIWKEDLNVTNDDNLGTKGLF